MALRYTLQAIRQVSIHVRYAFGRFPRHCNLCGHKGRFYAFGFPLRLDAVCPRCGGMERHRQLALLDASQPFFAGKRVLHIAPEPVLARYIRAQSPASYTDCDTHMPHVALRQPIESLTLPDNSMDTILCSHVLEHIPDDAAALRQLHRILAPGGCALLLAPVIESWPYTYENPAITSPAQRTLHFGQHDHVRVYGRDLRARIQAAGFTLTEFTATEPQLHQHSLVRGETIFIAKKN